MFRIYKPSHFLLTQEIYNEDPLSWLMKRREEANYRNAKFWEPNIPKHFEQIVRFGVRKVIRHYMTDSLNSSLFDPEHAILAYPLTVLQCAYIKSRNFKKLNYTKKESKYLRNLFKDQHGRIPEIYALIN